MRDTNHEAIVTSLLRHYTPLPPGVGWYRESRREARRIARRYGLPVRRVAGVIAALSPMMTWKGNITLADQLCREGQCGGLRSNVANATRILEGERPLDVLKGPKVRAFYRAIMGDGDAAVVDRWIARAAGVDETLTANQYERVAEGLRDAASRVGLSTADFQAQVWTSIRGKED